MSFVSNGDVRIAIYEHGNPDGPTVVMVHGWPDSHVLWDGVVPLLADRFRLITYDNRGVGPSSSPKSYREYTTARLADDFAAVIDAVSPGRPVHVLAHDWGSVSVWEYLARRRSAHPRRVVHVGFRSQPGPSGGLDIRQPQAPVPAEAAGADADSDAVAELHGGVLDTVRDTGDRACRADAAPDPPTARARRRHPTRPDPPLRRHHPRGGEHAEDLPRQLLSLVLRAIQARPLCRRPGAVDRQHGGSVRPHVQLRRRVPLGGTAVAPRHQGWALVAVLASAGAGRIGCRPRRRRRRTSAVAGDASRAGRPATRAVRRHAGVGHRRGKRHRPRDRARIRPAGRRSGGQRRRRGQRPRRREDHCGTGWNRTRVQAGRRPTPKRSRRSPTRCAPSTASPTSW